MLQGTNVVMLVTLIIWFGLFAYLWSLDGKLKRLQEEVQALVGEERADG